MEPLVLGLTVGLSCLASCGAVLAPWLVAERRPFAATGWLLAQVLAGRLAGYLLFAVAAWALGVVVFPSDLRTRALVFGLTHLGLAAVLAAYLVGQLRGHRHRATRAAGWLFRLFASCSRGRAVALGLLTGLNLCPPFVVAAVRAAEGASLPSSLAFFALFFVGTTVWFLPFLAIGALRRLPDARPVALVALALVAAYYAYVGAVTVGWRLMHG